MFYEGCLCPVCEVGSLKLVSRTEEFVYKGNKIVLTRDVWGCSECQEFFFQAKDQPEIERTLTDRRRKVDGLLVSEEIQAIREHLCLTTADFASLLRIPEQDLMYYETGQDAQSYELDDVLRILRDYPEAINVFKQERKIISKPRLKRKSSTGRSRHSQERTPQPTEV